MGHGKSRGLWFFFCMKRRTNNHQMGKGVFFLHHRIVSAVKRVEFVSDRMSYTVLRARWCNIVVLSVHAPSEDKGGDSKDSFYE